MRSWIMYVLFITTLLAFQACKDPYNPPVTAAPNQYLVIDGFINSADSSVFRLTNSINLAQKFTDNSVKQAQVSVEGENNFSIGLIESSQGYYKGIYGNLDPSQKYRLRIMLKDGKEYISDFVEIKDAPLIDTVEWQPENGGVQFYLSTHDANNKSIYYRWEFYETWKYHSYYSSSLKYDNFTFVDRPFEENIYFCWKSDTSKNLSLATTLQQSDDHVYRYPINLIPAGDVKISYQYSVLFRQFVLDAEAFQYWQNLKKLSETMGSIFDPQPSQIKGNIRSVSNPNEVVLGYVSAGKFSEKRIFINQPLSLAVDDCKDLKSIQPIDALIYYYFSDGSYIPIDEIYDHNLEKQMLEYSFKSCVDCRVKGGTTKKPDFWPN